MDMLVHSKPQYDRNRNGFGSIWTIVWRTPLPPFPLIRKSLIKPRPRVPETRGGLGFDHGDRVLPRPSVLKIRSATEAWWSEGGSNP